MDLKQTFQIDGATYERPEQPPYILRNFDVDFDHPVEPVFWYGTFWGHVQLGGSTRIRWTTSFGETFDFTFMDSERRVFTSIQ